MLGARHANFRFDRSGAPADLVAELDGVRAQNEAARARRGKLTRRAIFAIVYLIIGAPIVFICLMLGFATLGTILGEGDDTIFAVVSLSGVALGAFHALCALIFVVVCFVQRGRVSVMELDDYKLAAGAVLLRTLASDVRPGAPVRAYIDFASAINAPATASPTGPAHVQRWFHCSLPLADKSVIRVDATVRMKRRSRPKRRYTKKKDKYEDVIDIRIHLKNGSLPPDAAARIQTRFAYAFPRMLKCRIQPKGALLRFATAPAVIISGRGDQIQGAEQRLQAQRLLNLVMKSYRSVCSARVADAPR